MADGTLSLDSYIEALGYQVDLSSPRKLAILRQTLVKVGAKKVQKINLTISDQDRWLQKVIGAAVVAEPTESMWISSVIELWLNSIPTKQSQAEIQRFQSVLLKQLGEIANFNLMSEGRKFDFVTQLLVKADQKRKIDSAHEMDGHLVEFQNQALQVFSLNKDGISSLSLPAEEQSVLLKRAIEIAKSLKEPKGVLNSFEHNVLVPLLAKNALDELEIKNYREFLVSSYLDGKLGSNDLPLSLHSIQSRIFSKQEIAILIEADIIDRLNKLNLHESSVKLLSWAHLDKDMNDVFIKAWLSAKSASVAEVPAEALLQSFKEFEESNKFNLATLVDFYAGALTIRNNQGFTEDEMTLMRRFASKSAAFTQAWSLDPHRGPLHKPGFCRVALSKIFGSGH